MATTTATPAATKPAPGTSSTPAKKPRAKKAPAKTTRPEGTAPEGTAPDVTAAAEPTITFRGRTMNVKMPIPEQLAVWHRIARRLQTMTGDETKTTVDGAELAETLDRGMRVIDSVLVDPADHTWLEDQFLNGDLTLEQAAAIVTMAISELRPSADTTAPTTGPQARRRR